VSECIGGDPHCPCQDGDTCHYEDDELTKGWPIPSRLGELFWELSDKKKDEIMRYVGHHITEIDMRRFRKIARWRGEEKDGPLFMNAPEWLMRIWIRDRPEQIGAKLGQDGKSENVISL
jgi:hypothetical protein